MSYLHCHTKDCNWSQDDFYSKSYNPLTKIWSDIKWLWKPKITSVDKYIVKDLLAYSNVPVYEFKRNVKGQFYFFSWNWLLLEIVKDIKLAFKQKWWTYNSFKKDIKAVCPKCKQRNFDID